MTPAERQTEYEREIRRLFRRTYVDGVSIAAFSDLQTWLGRERATSGFYGDLSRIWESEMVEAFGYEPNETPPLLMGWAGHNGSSAAFAWGGEVNAETGKFETFLKNISDM